MYVVKSKGMPTEADRQAHEAKHTTAHYSDYCIKPKLSSQNGGQDHKQINAFGSPMLDWKKLYEETCRKVDQVKKADLIVCESRTLTKRNASEVYSPPGADQRSQIPPWLSVVMDQQEIQNAENILATLDGLQVQFEESDLKFFTDDTLAEIGIISQSSRELMLETIYKHFESESGPGQNTPESAVDASWRKRFEDKQKELFELKISHLRQRKRARQNMEQNFRCKICQEIAAAPATLPCAHTYCRLCVDQYVHVHYQHDPIFGINEKDPSCPYCRQAFTMADIREADFMLKSAIQSFSEQFMTENEYRDWQEREAGPASSSPAQSADRQPYRQVSPLPSAPARTTLSINTRLSPVAESDGSVSLTPIPTPYSSRPRFHIGDRVQVPNDNRGVNFLVDYPKFVRGTVTQPGQSLHGYQKIKFDDDDVSIFVQDDILMPVDGLDLGPPQPPPDAERWRRGDDVVVELPSTDDDEGGFFEFNIGTLDVPNLEHGVWTVKFMVTADDDQSSFRYVLIHQNRLRLT
tara:strand:+ start:5291 stop:6856 length:1566 start_codon:yes stop_codon:yes gene_type:complete